MKDYLKKELICRKCEIFLDLEELKDGKCPECGGDENMFHNDLEN